MISKFFSNSIVILSEFEESRFLNQVRDPSQSLP